MLYWNTRFAGLSPLQKNSPDYYLALVTRKWFRWHIEAIHYGQLAYLKTYCHLIPIALAVSDDDILHWTEEFPSHLSMKVINAYLRLSKPELLADPANSLTLEKLTPAATHSISIRCWLLTAQVRHKLWQTWQQYDLSIGALEPFSCLEARTAEPYTDKQQLLANINPSHQAAVFRALKLACRHHWAENLS